MRESAGEQRVSVLINDAVLETYINMELESVEIKEKSEKEEAQQQTAEVVALANQNNQ